MLSLSSRTLAIVAFVLCFFASTVQAGPLDINATLPNINDGNPRAIERITISSTIVAIVLMTAGFVFAFLGHKFFKVTLFLAGFYCFATLAWITLRNVEPTKGYGSNAEWIYMGVSGAVGLMGGFLVLCFWRLGFAALGGVAGFYLAIFILSWAKAGVIADGTGRTIFIVCCVLVGVVLTFFVERHVVILGTAIVGSGSFFIGLDNFVRTGFQQAFVAFLTGNKESLEYQVTGKVYGMLAGTLTMMIVGACYQYYTHRGHFIPKTHRQQQQEKGVEEQGPHQQV